MNFERVLIPGAFERDETPPAFLEWAEP